METNKKTVLSGSCYCEKIKFSTTLPTKFVAHCHCENCRRAHGAAFVTWAGFNINQFKIINGSDFLGRYKTETDATRSFCKICGTTLFYEGSRWPNEIHIALANINDLVDKLPKSHAYLDRSPDWSPILHKFDSDKRNK